MDPKETLILLLLALQAGERAEAQDHADNLADWLSKDGFVPVIDAAFLQEVTKRLSGNAQQWVLTHTHEHGTSLYPFLFQPDGVYRAPDISKVAPQLLLSSFEPDKRETLDLDTMTGTTILLFKGKEFGCRRHLGPLNEGDDPIVIPFKKV